MCCVGTTDQHQTRRQCAYGDPVLRDRGPDRPSRARPIPALTPCMPCSFGLLRWYRSAACGQHHGSLEVTVSVRYIPLVTAAYGTWVARPARTLTLRPGGDGSQLNRRVRSVLGGHRLAGKSPQGSRQAHYPVTGMPSSANASRRSLRRRLSTIHFTIASKCMTSNDRWWSLFCSASHPSTTGST